MEVDEILKRYAAGERNFQRVNLQEAELTNANLQGADFSNADLRQTRLGKTNFNQGCLREANLSEAILWGIDLQQFSIKPATKVNPKTKTSIGFSTFICGTLDCNSL